MTIEVGDFVTKRWQIPNVGAVDMVAYVTEVDERNGIVIMRVMRDGDPRPASRWELGRVLAYDLDEVATVEPTPELWTLLAKYRLTING